jgi:hypothetical protein
MHCYPLYCFVVADQFLRNNWPTNWLEDMVILMHQLFTLDFAVNGRET